MTPQATAELGAILLTDALEVEVGGCTAKVLLCHDRTANKEILSSWNKISKLFSHEYLCTRL